MLDTEVRWEVGDLHRPSGQRDELQRLKHRRELGHRHGGGDVQHAPIVFHGTANVEPGFVSEGATVHRVPWQARPCAATRLAMRGLRGRALTVHPAGLSGGFDGRPQRRGPG